MTWGPLQTLDGPRDQSGHVVISPDGELFSVARAVGKKSKHLAKRLGAPEKLPSVTDSRAQLARDLTQTYQRHRKEAELQKKRELAPFEKQRSEMAAAHRAERVRLDERQKQRWSQESKERAARIPGGMRGL